MKIKEFIKTSDRFNYVYDHYRYNTRSYSPQSFYRTLDQLTYNFISVINSSIFNYYRDKNIQLYKYVNNEFSQYITENLSALEERDGRSVFELYYDYARQCMHALYKRINTPESVITKSAVSIYSGHNEANFAEYIVDTRNIMECVNYLKNGSNLHIVDRFRSNTTLDLLKEKYGDDMILVFSKYFMYDYKNKITFIDFENAYLNSRINNIVNKSAYNFFNTYFEDIYRREEKYDFDDLMAHLNFEKLDVLNSHIRNMTNECNNRSIADVYRYLGDTIADNGRRIIKGTCSDIIDATEASKNNLVRQINELNKLKQDYFVAEMSLIKKDNEERDNPKTLETLKFLEISKKFGQISDYTITKLSDVDTSADIFYDSTARHLMHDYPGTVRIKIRTNWLPADFIDMIQLKRTYTDIVWSDSAREEIIKDRVLGDGSAAFFVHPYTIIIYIIPDIGIKHFFYTDQGSDIDYRFTGNGHTNYGSGAGERYNARGSVQGNTGCVGTFSTSFAACSGDMNLAKYISLTIQYLQTLVPGDLAGNYSLKHCPIVDLETGEVLSCHKDGDKNSDTYIGWYLNNESTVHFVKEKE